MHQESSSFGAYGSLASDHSTKILGPGATVETQVTKHYTNYSFIAVLGMAQRLHVRFLPITWQAPLGPIGGGGQASINQALVNANLKFAFKCFKPRPDDPFREIVQEMAVLGHPTIRKHKHIIRLEGICWDVRRGPGGFNEVWPVLMFEMTPLGDLYSFSRSVIFESLSTKDRLSLCAEVGIAMRDMHVNDIIHGDIKPGNVLIFADGDRYIAKVADFGSEPWNPPEVEDREETYSLSQAKRIDVYSFALLCTWLVFEAGSSTNPWQVLGKPNDELVSFEQAQSKHKLLELWKKDANDKLVDWARERACEHDVFDECTRENFCKFVSLTLTFDPFSRCVDFENLLRLLVPPWTLPNALPAQRSLAPEQESFELPPSLEELYYADFRLRLFIIEDLEYIASHRELTFRRISPAKAALQFALCCSLGFGDDGDIEHALFQLQKHSLTLADLKRYIDSMARSTKGSSNEDSLYSTLEGQGHTETMDFVQYYRERELLAEAEIQYQQEVEGVKACFGEDHILYLRLAYRLAMIIHGQGRPEEAKKRFTQLVKESSQALGRQHPLTLVSEANLALIYNERGQSEKAERLMTRVVEVERNLKGESHIHTLKSMNELARIYKDLKQWAKSEELLSRTINKSLQVYGEDHYLTALSKGYMVSLRIDQGRWDEAEELENKLKGKMESTLGTEHPLVLSRKLSLASIHVYQGRPKEAEEVLLQLVPTCERVLGDSSDLTRKGKDYLAIAYEKQGQWTKVEQLRKKTSDAQE